MTHEETRQILVAEFTAVAKWLHCRTATDDTLEVSRDLLRFIVRQTVRQGADPALLSIDFEFKIDVAGDVHWWPLTDRPEVFALWKRIFREPLTVTSAGELRNEP